VGRSGGGGKGAEMDERCALKKEEDTCTQAATEDRDMHKGTLRAATSQQGTNNYYNGATVGKNAIP